jgi:hypothetical protein
MNEKDLNIYFFYAGGYCAQYQVLAHSKEEALEFVRLYCIEMDVSRFKRVAGVLYETQLVFPFKLYPHSIERHNLEELLEKEGFNYPDYKKYCDPSFEVKVFGIGQVIETEVA